MFDWKKAKTKRENLREKKKEVISKQAKNNKPQTKRNVTKVITSPTIIETEKFILDTVKGQDAQVRDIVTATYRSMYFEGMKSNVLIIGKSGTGKTEVLKQLAKKVGKICIEVDANEFTQEGYQGKDVNDIIIELLNEANYDVEKAQKGIVIIDEIDKKAGAKTTERDVSGKGVLNSFLKLVEGKTIMIALIDSYGGSHPIAFKTDQLTFFFAGAFSGMEGIKEQRVKATRRVGFSVGNSDVVDRVIEEKNLKEDLVKYGLTEEFVGRMDTIVQMNDLSEKDLIEILKTSKKSKLKTYTTQLAKQGIKVKYTENIINSIAAEAKKANTGARELNNIVNYMFAKILYQVMSKPKGTYKECVLLDGIEKDNTKFELK